MNLIQVLRFLETYKGRDRVLRLFCYLSKLLSGLSSSNVSPQLDNLSKQLSTCRTTLRLLDDVPALANAFDYGLGKKGEDAITRLVNIISNFVDIAICPVEHISWAIDHRILLSKSTVWDRWNVYLWVASIYLNIVAQLLKLRIVCRKKRCLVAEAPRGRSSDEIKDLSRTESRLKAVSFRLALDLIYAVNYLPPGVLWSGRLSKWQLGALGTVSSVIALCL